MSAAIANTLFHHWSCFPLLRTLDLGDLDRTTTTDQQRSVQTHAKSQRSGHLHHRCSRYASPMEPTWGRGDDWRRWEALIVGHWRHVLARRDRAYYSWPWWSHDAFPRANHCRKRASWKGAHPALGPSGSLKIAILERVQPLGDVDVGAGQLWLLRGSRVREQRLWRAADALSRDPIATSDRQSQLASRSPLRSRLDRVNSFCPSQNWDPMRSTNYSSQPGGGPRWPNKQIDGLG